MSNSTTIEEIKVGLVSLGCAKNLVDSEIMLGHLLKDGMTITNNPEDADVVIVNTCSFIDAAQEESVDSILEASEIRKATDKGQGLIVAGCLTQRYHKELPKLLPEVDVFMGIDEVDQVSKLVQYAQSKRSPKDKELTQETQDAPTPPEPTDKEEPVLEVHTRPEFIPDYETPRFRLTPDHFAYLKIAEGCNHPCSFCIIPRMRGSHRSRGLEDIVKEARNLIADGVKEINLISQDSTYYGLDLRSDHKRNIASPEKFQAASGALPTDAPTLARLLRELNAIEGEFWIRILYTHPAHWTDELIETIRDCPKVARYIDIPLQHIHPLMLEKMRRETSKEYIENLLVRIRKGIPGISIRTTFIVGFPGETEECFQGLLDFIKASRFERMGVFTYSHEEGTRAGNMQQQIEDEVKQKRRDQVMQIQQEVSQSIFKDKLGSTIRVLVENRMEDSLMQNADIKSWEHSTLRAGEPTDLGELAQDHDVMLARGEMDAPDIDGRVYLLGEAKLGEFIDARVVGATDYDLIAEPIASE